MLKETHKLFLTLVWLTSNFAEILFANFVALNDEDFTPKVLDKGVSEELTSHCGIVFFEYVLKESG